MNYQSVILRICVVIFVISTFLTIDTGLQSGNTQKAFLEASLKMFIAAILWWRSLQIDKHKLKITSVVSDYDHNKQKNDENTVLGKKRTIYLILWLCLAAGIGLFLSWRGILEPVNRIIMYSQIFSSNVFIEAVRLLFEDAWLMIVITVSFWVSVIAIWRWKEWGIWGIIGVGFVMLIYNWVSTETVFELLGSPFILPVFCTIALYLAVYSVWDAFE